LASAHWLMADVWSLESRRGAAAVLDPPSSAEPPAPPPPPLSIQYADFAYWQRQSRSHPDMAAQLAYWREQLHDPLPVMKLATARPKRPLDAFRTARREVALPAPLSEAAKRFSQQGGGTLFMALVAAFNTLL